MDEPRELEPDEVQEILDWAANIGATLTLMVHEYQAQAPDEQVEQLERFRAGIQRMYELMPDCMSDTAHEIAIRAYEQAEAEEAIVEEFLDEIKDL